MDRNIRKPNLFYIDNGDRRSGNDRRRFAYSGHIPERRRGGDHARGGDRRSGKDRRKVFSDISSPDLRSRHGVERRIAFIKSGENRRREGVGITTC
jgi:hypothetical protein